MILPYLLILILVRYDDKPSDKVDSSYYIDSFNRKVTFIAYNSAFFVFAQNIWQKIWEKWLNICSEVIQAHSEIFSG